ncbi:unnamed protein product [Spirodela intermedia]|uniref:Uncharacterized protein n=1 Tax=Spirodela intermedia TaxID=51605 RepID=A0A7I8IED2_SPIIN|nr:unnamed protein product [Spirodela intermedia]CAA6656148.1 unnamed protein product [Spirodela intermedia]
MAADSAEDSGLSPLPNPEEEVPKGVLEELPWLDDAIERTYGIARTRISDIGTHHRLTSSNPLRIWGIFGDARAWYAHYEAVAFGKLKEGILVAASQPTLSCGVAMGLGIFALKSTNSIPRFLTSTLAFKPYSHKLVKEAVFGAQSSLSSAEIKVNMMRKSIDVMKLERQKLEFFIGLSKFQIYVMISMFLKFFRKCHCLINITLYSSSFNGKNQMEWGKTELRKTSNQIQGIVHSIYNIERQARVYPPTISRRQRSQILSKVIPQLFSPLSIRYSCMAFHTSEKNAGLSSGDYIHS